MDIGFTGSRIGPVTQQQADKLEVILKGLRGSENKFRQGCCIGGDEEATMMAHKLGYFIVGHPPTTDTLISEVAMMLSNELREAKDYLDRNLDIVIECDKLIVLPSTMTEMQRSGTWYTYRRAVEMNKPRVIVWPNGTMTEEG